MTFWNWLSGKKTKIAAMYWGLAVPMVAIIWPEGAPVYVVKGIAIAGLILTYFGLGHAAVKKYIGGT